ncbi:MAG: RNA polymerase sigma factor [Deltaproteobacteria bacterium]|nr:RNA polymerase sigma factor [Deltaproteobacteria bacterium]
MTLAQHGDATAYRALLDDLGPQLTRFLRRRVRNADDLPDAFQDTFLALHRARFTYQSPRPIEPWLFAIARNVAADYGRRWQRRRRHELPTDAAPEPTADAPSRDVGSELETALRTLPNRQREALQMLKLQDLSIREAAARLGTTPGALKLRAHRAYLALRAAFRK